MDIEQLPDRLSHAVEGLPDRVTHAVGGLRDRAAGAVSSDGGSLFREMGGLGRRIDKAEGRLFDRLDGLEDSLSDQLSRLVSAEKRTSWPRRLFWLLVGGGVGAASAYLADPERGPSRRTQLSDQAGARARTVADDLKAQAKLTADRAKGQIVEGVKDALPDAPEEDARLLEQRIKSQVFGRRDDVQDVVLRIDGPGTVSMKGTVPSTDSQRELLAEVAEVEGVVDVRSELSIRSM